MIKEDQLRGIEVALKAHAPELIPSLHDVLRNGCAFPPSRASGASIYAGFAGTVPLIEGEKILSALKSIEKRFGYNAVFAGRQINWLVQCWQQFSEVKRLTDGNGNRADSIS